MPDNLIINLPILAKACSVYSRFGSAMTGMTTHAPNVGNIGVYSAVQFGASWTLWRCSIHAHQIKLVVPRAHRCSSTCPRAFVSWGHHELKDKSHGRPEYWSHIGDMSSNPIPR